MYSQFIETAIMDDIEQNDISLQHEFSFCEDIIKQLESGKQSTKDLQVKSEFVLNFR